MNTITNDQIKEAFERPELLKELFPDAFKPVLEAGKWYYGKKGQVAFYEIKAIYSYTPNGYGMDANGDWCENTSWTFVNDPLYWRPATPEEVEKALINEAVKRGFKEGVKFISLFEERNKWVKTGNITFEYDKSINVLRFWSDISEVKEDYYIHEERSFCEIFRHGKWAEIIQETELELTLDEIAEKFGVYKVKIKK